MTCWYAIDGQRVCRIQSVEDRQRVDGTIRMTLPCQEQGLPGIDGVFEVHAEAEDGVYLAQALAGWIQNDCLVLSCTPLGETMHRDDSPLGDNYLVFHGHEPIPVIELIEARSQCHKGDHIRLELLTEHWNKLNFQLSPDELLGCGRWMGTDKPEEHIWDFRQVHLTHNPSEIIFADLIMLGQRQRLCMTIDLAMRGSSNTTVIGHTRLRSAITR